MSETSIPTNLMLKRLFSPITWQAMHLDLKSTIEKDGNFPPSYMTNVMTLISTCQFSIPVK